MINYVTYDQNGALTGAYAQELHPSHASNYIEVSDEQRQNWVLYEANQARDGVVVLPVIVPTPPALTVQDFADAVQKHLDDTAKSRGYGGILSAVSYVGDADPVFNAEGIALKAWRSDVWNACHVKLAEVNAGGAVPTIPELIAILPAVVW